MSSTWRLGQSVEDLRRYFSYGFRNRITGKTPALRGQNREDEAEAWIRENTSGNVLWAALDDTEHYFENQRRYLYLCDSTRGFTKPIFRRLRR